MISLKQGVLSLQYHISLIVTTRKNVVVSQKNTKKNSKHTETKRHQTHTQKKQDKKQGTMDLQNNQKTKNKMATVSPYLSIIKHKCTNSPMKRHRMGEWIRKTDTTICCLQET